MNARPEGQIGRAIGGTLEAVSKPRNSSHNPLSLKVLKSVLKPPLVALLLAVPPAAGQGDSGEEVRYQIRTSVDLVVVPVTAKDSRGELVVDLSRKEFRLWENEVEQPIRYFSADPFPLSVIVLVDQGLDRAAHQNVRETLPALAGAFAPEDEFALFTFDAYPRVNLEFTSDSEALRAALRKLVSEWENPTPPPGVGGGPMDAGPRINRLPVDPRVPSTLPATTRSVKALHDALHAAALALRNREPGRRRMVLLISDGQNSRVNLRSFEETREALLEADASVYAVGVSNARYALPTTILDNYARATGGDAQAPLDRTGLERSYQRLIEQARYRYTLVYARPPVAGGREYRRIAVTVDRAGVRLLTREGYFAGISID
jgi:VWFA-related protein